jgi:hypothetical protein
MESLGHFIFELLKITVLGFIYSSILYYIYNLIPENKKPEWIKTWLKTKKRLWLSISLFLLFYMFTPYGNHGLGDLARIPISFSKEIININSSNYGKLDEIKSSEDNDIYLTQFKKVNNILCGNLDSDFYDYQNSFFVYNIDTEKLEEFETENGYNKFAESKNLPKSNELKSFKENYSEYWSGWRFFLLP